MTDYQVLWKEKRFNNHAEAQAFAMEKHEEFSHWASTRSGTGYNDATIEFTELPQPDGRILYIVKYRVAEKIPFAQSISRRVDAAALDALPAARRNLLTSHVVSDDWDLRKKKVVLPKYLQKGRLKDDA